MKRKMITGERIMYVDADTSLNCVFTAKIRGSFSPENLHAALAKIQDKHPALHAVIKEDYKKVPYLISCDSLSAIPVRIVERQGDEDWKAASEAEWSKPFKEKNAPLARVVWVKGTAVSELLLICPHCICDGKSISTLMSELLSLLDDPAQKLDAYLPFSSIPELLSERYSIGKLIRVRLLSVMASWFLSSKSERYTPPAGNSYMLHWKLDAAHVALVTAGCKNAGITVHAALCVAFLEAFRAVKGERAKGNTVTPVDIRRFVPEIREDMMFAMAPTVEVSLDQQADTDFWTKAKKLKEDLDTKIAGLDGRGSLMMSEYFSVKRIVKYLKSSEGTHDVTLSNMGRLTIPEHYGSFEVETIYSPNVAFPWKNPNTAIISTFKGEMDFTFCSHDAFLDQEDAKAIRDKIIDLLSNEVKVDYAAAV